MLAVSQAERAQLLAMGVEPRRIRVVPNPLDLDEWAPPPARGGFRRQHDLGEAPLVVFLGKITPRKRLDVVIAAMARVQMRAARLVVAGNDMGAAPPPGDWRRALGIADRTQFIGLLTGRARLDLLADADVVVYPSADEVFGLVPLEALLCGTPVVVADDSGCGEVVGPLDGAQVVAVGDRGGAGGGDRSRAGLAAGLARTSRVGRGGGRVNGLADRWWPNKSMPCIEKSSLADAGVSVVVPVLNGARWLPDVLAAIRADVADRPHEILVSTTAVATSRSRSAVEADSTISW